MHVSTILVCDDNLLNRTLVKVILGEGCYRVIESDSGHACLDYIENHPGEVDVLLLDISMRDMSGFEVCAQLRREQPVCAPLTIIAYTAHAMEEERQRYFSAGFNDVLLKPVDEAALQEVVQRYLKDVPNCQETVC